ncbi:MAG TPA: MarR family transcriptional regulator [Thermoleophilaceae bacterium]|nr:MarR family transcriptional regulator [Thermoleophilaceae bacterium]
MPAKRDSEPAVEAWTLIWRLMHANRPRMIRLAQEFDLAPMQLHALRLIEPGRELPMGALAQSLFCDPSNVTGIVDRLEARGLIERRGAENDRRVKILALTPEGERVRAAASRRMEEPPPEIAALPRELQIALRDALSAALEGATPDEDHGAGPATTARARPPIQVT